MAAAAGRIGWAIVNQSLNCLATCMSFPYTRQVEVHVWCFLRLRRRSVPRLTNNEID